MHPNFRDPTRFDVECQYCIEMTVAYNRQTSHREPSRRCNPLNRIQCRVRRKKMRSD